MLNHKRKGVEGTYNTYDYFEERLEALEQWACVLAPIETGGKVVPIRRAGAQTKALDFN